MALFIATCGASHPWLTVSTIPDQEVPAHIRRMLREVRAILRDNAARLGEPCRLRAVVATGLEVDGPHVALVDARDGRIGRVFPGVDLYQSAARAVTEAHAAARKAASA